MDDDRDRTTKEVDEVALQALVELERQLYLLEQWARIFGPSGGRGKQEIAESLFLSRAMLETLDAAMREILARQESRISGS